MEHGSAALGPDSEDNNPNTAMELANEFAHVLVRKVSTRNGVRLEIAAPRTGRAIRLCPLELESLTWQTTDVFSGFLATPMGPESSTE